MTEWLTVLHTGATELGLTLTAEQEAHFARYLDLLLERNQQVNLTAITDPCEVAAKHFVDALSVETLWHPQPGDRLIDFGTGAGVPGIPLAIRYPEVQITLNDSVRKKVDFLAEVVNLLPLPNVTPVWARIEELGHQPAYRARFNVAVARAVAHLSALIEYALPLVKVGGHLLAMKGPSGTTEVTESARALEALGGTVQQVRTLHLAGVGERVLILIRKVRQTAPQYPRAAAAMKKRPLYLDSRQHTP